MIPVNVQHYLCCAVFIGIVAANMNVMWAIKTFQMTIMKASGDRKQLFVSLEEYLLGS